MYLVPRCGSACVLYGESIERFHCIIYMYIPQAVTCLVSLSPDLLTGSLPSHKLSLSHTDQNGNTALHLACVQGHEDSALAILAKCTDELVHTTNTAEKTSVFVCLFVCLFVVCCLERHLESRGVEMYKP